MKAIVLAAVLSGLMSGAAQAGIDTTSETSGGQVCLWSYQVSHTHVVNPSKIQFVMKDGKIWQNDLQGSCPGLNFHGFVIIGHEDEFCGGQGISVIKTGEVCQLGKFTAAVTPASSPVSHP